jgi:hypothetical protein
VHLKWLPDYQVRMEPLKISSYSITSYDFQQAYHWRIFLSDFNRFSLLSPFHHCARLIYHRPLRYAIALVRQRIITFLVSKFGALYEYLAWNLSGYRGRTYFVCICSAFVYRKNLMLCRLKHNSQNLNAKCLISTSLGFRVHRRFLPQYGLDTRP